MKRIILASTSPYRKALLERLAIPFECCSPNVDEDFFKKEIINPLELANRLGFEKSKAIASIDPNAVVIGSDQLAHLDGSILGKPKNFDKAFEQLKFLNGKTHELITSVTIFHQNESLSFTNVTKLKMRKLTDNQLKFYLKKDQPFDCAGSYKLELSGITLFKEIDTTDQTAIVGLPLIETVSHLAKFGVLIPVEEI